MHVSNLVSEKQKMSSNKKFRHITEFCTEKCFLSDSELCCLHTELPFRHKEILMSHVLHGNLSISRFPFLEKLTLTPLIEGERYSVFMCNWALLVYDEDLDDMWFLGDGTSKNITVSFRIWNKREFNKWLEVLKDGTVTNSHPL